MAEESDTYVEAVVVLVDVLGFRETVASQPAREVLTLLQSFQQTWRAGSLDSMFPRAESSKRSFSDTAVRVMPVPTDGTDDDRGDLFIRAALEVRDVQIKLLRVGVLIRGAITIGEIYVGSAGVFGPAFIAAVDLEKKASFSRVVVQQQLLEITERSRYAHRIQYVIGTPPDGVPFVDYLHSAKFEYFAVERYLDFLQEHKAWLRPHLRRLATGGPREREKLEWAIYYHNTVVQSLRPWIERHGFEEERFLIRR